MMPSTNELVGEDLCIIISFDEPISLVVVVVEIIKLYLVQTGRFLATTGYVAPSPNHVQNNVHDQNVSQWSENS